MVVHPDGHHQNDDEGHGTLVGHTRVIAEGGEISDPPAWSATEPDAERGSVGVFDGLAADYSAA